MISTNLNEKILFKALEKTKFGSVKLKMMNPFSEHTFGEGSCVCELEVANSKVLNRVMSGGDIELATAIIHKEIIISNEAGFIEWACRNDEALKSTFYGKFLYTLVPRLQKALRVNTVSGAKRNIMKHYDLGNNFYSQWLDSSMTYSSALFLEHFYNEDLTQAQMRKYDRIIDQLQIRSTDHVLEIGCGWGGFFSRVVERTGCQVTAVMNSPAQAAHNRRLIKNKRLEGSVNLELTDYRNIQGVFDKVVSIEMIEAVGQKYWPTYFGKISESLKSGGQSLIQSITIRENRFHTYSKNPDFISTMIFPGGMLLTNKLIADNADRAGMKQMTLPFEFGFSYAETLKRWRDQFLSAWHENLFPELDEQFINLWRFYLAYCEGAFRSERINVGQFQLEKPKRFI